MTPVWLTTAIIFATVIGFLLGKRYGHSSPTTGGADQSGNVAKIYLLKEQVAELQGELASLRAENDLQSHIHNVLLDDSMKKNAELYVELLKAQFPSTREPAIESEPVKKVSRKPTDDTDSAPVKKVSRKPKKETAVESEPVRRVSRKPK